MPKTHTEIDNIEESQFLSSTFALANYMFAGKAKVTVLNTKTSIRHTFFIRVVSYRTKKGGWKKAYKRGPWYMYLRVGGISSITPGQFVRVGRVKKSKHKGFYFIRDINVSNRVDDKAIKGFVWLLMRINRGKELPGSVKVWRSHHCGRCGMELISEYRLLSYGPVCCGHLGIDSKVIFKTLAALKGNDTRDAIELARELVYKDVLSNTENLIVNLLPGLAGNYAREHMKGKYYGTQ